MSYRMRTLTLAGAALALAMTQASAQTKWNLPSAYPQDNPHVENLNLFAKDVAEATGGKLQIDADIHRALEDGTLKEASLDVFETEPLPASSPLWTHPRVVVTPGIFVSRIVKIGRTATQAGGFKQAVRGESA